MVPVDMFRVAFLFGTLLKRCFSFAHVIRSMLAILDWLARSGSEWVYQFNQDVQLVVVSLPWNRRGGQATSKKSRTPRCLYSKSS